MRMFTAMTLFFLAMPAFAGYVITPIGKIVATQGHVQPSCRMVLFKENASGNQKWFRIPDKSGTDIGSVALTALVSGKGATIMYDPNVTTGCGTEPAITVIEIDQ